MGSKVSWIVFKKELMDIFRDKKTFILGILIPLIMFPVLSLVMGKSMDKTTKQVENNLKVAIVDNSGKSSLAEFIKTQKNINLIQSDNIDEDVKSGKILAALEIPRDFDGSIEKEILASLKITYDNSSQASQIAMNNLKGFIDAYSKGVVSQRLSKRNISGEILNPVNVEMKTSVKEEEGFGKFMLSLMLPLMLVIYSVAGPMGAAVDLGAGEKERGTLEPLLTTQAGRLSLLWGKFFAITVMGLLTSVASLAGLFIAMRQEGGLFEGASGNIGTTIILLIGLVTLLLTMVFGALELAISIYARSFKEAQTYISPLMMISFVPTYATYMLDAKNIESFYFHIPLANVSCLLKEFISGIYNYSHIGITFGWIAVYIIGSVLFARYMFSKETVIFRT
ncbi:ABC transporter permease [Clostridium swellfunianum]|uniref:ABC transporter permease n=1 Tax=Clostridium swellfunianum TaxID=1367462 RepID=UPI00202E7EC7|nr:ABC transporter permease [Clostridium swellfunianum]MCM0647789.1 ABC transporter permease [Clostridium swellfunianum]